MKAKEFLKIKDIFKKDFWSVTNCDGIPTICKCKIRSYTVEENGQVKDIYLQGNHNQFTIDQVFTTENDLYDYYQKELDYKIKEFELEKKMYLKTIETIDGQLKLLNTLKTKKKKNITRSN